jgi:hypothetical protein
VAPSAVDAPLASDNDRPAAPNTGAAFLLRFRRKVAFACDMVEPQFFTVSRAPCSVRMSVELIIETPKRPPRQIVCSLCRNTGTSVGGIFRRIGRASVAEPACSE